MNNPGIEVLASDFTPESAREIGGVYAPPVLEAGVDRYGSLADTSLSAVRFYRDIALLRSDWTQVPDAPLSDEKKAEWATYRQALRDVTELDPIVLPSQSGFPSPPSA